MGGWRLGAAAALGAAAFAAAARLGGGTGLDGPGPALAALSTALDGAPRGVVIEPEAPRIETRGPGDLPVLEQVGRQVLASIRGREGWNVLLAGDDRARLVESVNDSMRRGLVAPGAVRGAMGRPGRSATMLCQIDLRPTAGGAYAVALRLLDPGGGLRFAAQAEFEHPRDAARRRRVHLAFKAAAALLSVVSAVSLASAAWGEAARRRRRAAALRELSAAMPALMGLINEGHASAALREAERWLEILPENVELFAFKQRLLALTRGNPEAWERAGVEADRVRRFSEAGAGLAASERESLRPLLDHSPELGLALQEADARVQAGAQAAAAERRARAAAFLRDAEAALARRAVGEGEALLREALDHGEDQAQALLSALAASRAARRLRVGPDLVVVKDGRASIGRRDADLVIDDERVSRVHVTVLLDPQGWTARDEGSRNGTRLGGRRLRTARLEDGDVLELAGGIAVEVRVLPEAVLLEARGRRLLCLRGSAACAVSPSGLLPGKGADAELAVVNGVLLWLEGATARVLAPEDGA